MLFADIIFQQISELDASRMSRKTLSNMWIRVWDIVVDSPSNDGYVGAIVEFRNMVPLDLVEEKIAEVYKNLLRPKILRVSYNSMES